MESYKQLKQVIEDKLCVGMGTNSGPEGSSRLVLKEKNLKNGRSSFKIHMSVTSLLNDVVQKSQLSTMLIQPYLDPYTEGSAIYHICYNPPNSQVFSLTMKREEGNGSSTARQADTPTLNPAEGGALRLAVTLLRRHSLAMLEDQCKQLFATLQKLCFAPAHKLLQGMTFEFFQPHHGPWYLC